MSGVQAFAKRHHRIPERQRPMRRSQCQRGVRAIDGGDARSKLVAVNSVRRLMRCGPWNKDDEGGAHLQQPLTPTLSRWERGTAKRLDALSPSRSHALYRRSRTIGERPHRQRVKYTASYLSVNHPTGGRSHESSTLFFWQGERWQQFLQ